MTSAPAEPIDLGRRLLGSATRAAGTRAGSAALAAFDQAIFSGTNFAAALLIARYATQSQLGVWQMAMTVVLLGYFVQDALILAPYRVRRYALAPEDRPAYFGSILIHQLATIFALQVVLAAAVVVVHLAAPRIEYEGVFAVLAFVLPCILARDAARRLATVHFENSGAVFVDAVCAALLLGGLAILFQTGQIDLRFAIALLGLATGVATIAWFCFQRAAFSIREANWREDWRANWQFGRWTLASMLVSNGATLLLMPWVLAFVQGEAVTGEFAAAMGVAGVTNLFVNGFGNFLGPHFARVFAQEGQAALRRALFVPTIGFGVGLGGATVAACFFAEPIAAALFAGKYPGVGTPIAFLVANGWMLGWGIVASTGLYAMHRPRGNLAADFVNLVAAVFALSLLVGPWGATGAAAAYFAGTFCGSTARWALLLRALYVPAAPTNDDEVPPPTLSTGEGVV